MKKKARVMPRPDIYAVCDSGGGSILDFYRGTFDSVFILLHPFIKPVGIPISRFSPETYPSKIQLKLGAEKVRWEHLLEVTPLKSLSQIDIGLRTGIGGLQNEFRNVEYEFEVSQIEDSEKLIRPSEGEIPELIQDDLLSSLQELDYRWAWISDEFGFERKLHWIEDLKDDDFMPSHGSIFTHDHQFLITTHWDSHFSLICSDQDKLKDFLSTGDYEGFYCQPETEIYWSLKNKNIQQVAAPDGE